MTSTRLVLFLATAVLTAACLLPLAQAVTPLSPWQDGIATNYGGPADGMDPYSPSFGTSAGSCGYGDLDKDSYPFWSVGALATSNQFYQAGPLNGCGQCFQIECLSTVDESKGTCNPDPNLRTVTIMVSDECPQCASNQIDLQALTFDKMAPMSVGRINMRYRRVECSPPADMKVVITDNRGAGGWISLNVQETGGRGAVKGVQLKGSAGDWTDMQSTWGAQWESSSQPSGPISFRFVPDEGSEVTAFNLLDGGESGKIPSRVQFTMHDRPGSNNMGGGGGRGSGGSSSSSSSGGGGASASSGGGSASVSSGGASASASSGSAQVEAFSGPPDYSSTTADSSASSPPLPGDGTSNGSGSWSSSTGRRLLM